MSRETPLLTWFNHKGACGVGQGGALYKEGGKIDKKAVFGGFIFDVVCFDNSGNAGQAASCD
jgi:hypothetical protein